MRIERRSKWNVVEEVKKEQYYWENTALVRFIRNIV
jgi:hypothetical protein